MKSAKSRIEAVPRPARSLRYRRIVLKLSGESFCPPGGYGIQIDEVNWIAQEVARVHSLGVETALVVGGGNILRGAQMSEQGINRATADQMGMLATVINALALQHAVEARGIETRVLSAIEMHQVAEPFVRRRAIRHLEKGRVAILAGGTGNPYFTTDTTAALRATELGAEVLLKATKVDGVYTQDPLRFPKSTKYRKLGYMAVLNQHLSVMDRTAITLCMENDLPIVVFSVRTAGNIERVVRGEDIGTLIEG
jgi:uridylate kinase